MKMKLSLLCSTLLASSVFAADYYVLDSTLSSVSFSTIKSQYVVEPASIRTLTGAINKDGSFSVSIDPTGIETGISIRDSRINELFLNSTKFPTIVASGKFDWKTLDKDAKTLDMLVNVNLYGKERAIVFNVSVIEADDYIIVNSIKPVIIAGSDFGIPSDNLTKLAATVGGISISERVPVNLSLVFKK